MHGDRYEQYGKNHLFRAGTLRIMAVFVGWFSLLCLCALILMWMTGRAYGGSASSASTEEEQIKARFSAGRLIGLPVNDDEGNEIAEIRDFIMNETGRVQLVVLSTGGIADIGEKTIAVPFADLSFKRQWTQRAVRTDEGTTIEVPWQPSWTAVYRAKAPDLDTRDYARLLNVHGSYQVNEIRIKEGDWLAGKRLRDCRLPDEGVTVLGVYRSDGSYLGVPRYDTEIYAGDTMILCGRSKALRELTLRRNDPSGQKAHEEAVSDQKSHETRQERQEAQYRK